VGNPIVGFKDNLREVNRLFKIHEEKTGKRRGRRYGVEVLNKSAVVLVTACWEAFVEDLAAEGFDFLVSRARSPSDLPKGLMQEIARRVRTEKDDRRIWDLAGTGWKKVVLKAHKRDVLKKHIGFFNTPNHSNIDELFRKILDLDSLSSSWRWKKMSVKGTRAKLSEYIKTRGAIAHRVSAARSITKSYVNAYAELIVRLAIKSQNRVRSHLHSITDEYPWPIVRLGKFS
jgi:hypothetical protein